jgi:hypothetical protein
MNKIFLLISEDISDLGGPMGSERVYTNFQRYFDDLKKAKDAADKDYFRGKEKGKKLKWIKGKNKWLRTDDLGYVMYHIKEINVE